MIISGNNNRDHILDYLAEHQSITAEQASILLGNQNQPLGNSTVYKTLNKLRSQRIIIKKKDEWSLSNEWRNNLISTFQKTLSKLPQEGERIIYELNSLSETDTHWKHYEPILRDQLGPDNTIYHYTPHQFWHYIPDRQQSELDYFNRMNNDKQTVRHTIGNETKYDKSFYKRFRTNHYRINLGKVKNLKVTDNPSIFGNYIINTKTSRAFYDTIHKAYNTAKDEAELKIKIAEALSNFGKSKVIIECNSKKASYLKRLLGKDFA